jgi:ribonucleoside-diphosphate reductase alpha chain
VIEGHMIRTGFLSRPRQPGEEEGAERKVLVAGEPRGALPEGAGSGRVCPRCSSRSLQRREGCWVCDNCSYSKCN